MGEGPAVLLTVWHQLDCGQGLDIWMEGRPCAVMPPRAAPEEKTVELILTAFYLAQKGESCCGFPFYRSEAAGPLP